MTDGATDAGRGERTRPSRLVLLGHPVSHSLSPRMHAAALRAADVPLTYEALDVVPAAFEGVLRALVAEGAAGNVTIPHKERALAACARVSPLAQRVGAVNTWLVEDEALVGDNTDVGGVHAAAALLGEGSLVRARVALLGAGGSAAAVLAAAERWPGASVRVWSRTPARARALAGRFGGVASAAADARDAVQGATLVVNATPVGLADDALPIPVDELPEGAAVLDLVYRAGETAWVRAARAAGHAAVDGLPVLVEQGALAFERWLGIAPDRAAMWRAVGGRPSALTAEG